MLKRTIYIGNSAHLRLQDFQMKIEDPKTKELKGTAAVEDIGFLVLDHYQITLSHQLMVALQKNNVAIISCDTSHMPLGLMLPLAGHVEHSERLKFQLNASEPLKKQLWKQTVEAKIYQQKEVLRKYKLPHEPMLAYLQQVKSGDTSNMEGAAAQYYWKQLFDDFVRDRDGEAPNNFLNYGYAILRSIAARALVSSGLHPTIGLFHKNKYNAYCLADDIMEPYRPYVDDLVVRWMLENGEDTELNKAAKAHLLKVATRDVVINGLVRPLITAMSITTSSLFKCYAGENRMLSYPMLR
jgi:CRISPR-associated protein Cas1